MIRQLGIFSASVIFVCASTMSAAAADKSAKDADAKDKDFAYQGEYVGTINGKDGPKKLGVQIIALGNGRFRAVGFPCGLPGDGGDISKKEEVESALSGGSVTFEGKYANSIIESPGSMKIVDKDGKDLGSLKHVVRKSSTLGAKAPDGAVVLFDGSSADNFTSPRGGGPARMTDDGLLMQGANSKQRFGSHKLHVEFRLPYRPTARGQGRGNSGCYLQGRYEVQMLDSFGLAGKHNECGGVYSIKDPDVNMCFPPLSWQAYDVDFTAAEFDENGKKTKNARMTVKHNGVVVHDNIELPKSTTASPLKEGTEPGFLHLQDHGNPVRYRNIWVVEKK